MFKQILDAVWNRVIVNWVLTLIGIAAAAGVVLVDQLTTVTATLGLPSWALSGVAALLALAGAYLRSKALTAPVP